MKGLKGQGEAKVPAGTARDRAESEMIKREVLSRQQSRGVEKFQWLCPDGFVMKLIFKERSEAQALLDRAGELARRGIFARRYMTWEERERERAKRGAKANRGADGRRWVRRSASPQSGHANDRAEERKEERKEDRKDEGKDEGEEERKEERKE